MKTLKERRELLNLKNFDNCLCFGNPASNDKEYDPEYCKCCRKPSTFKKFGSIIDNKRCFLTDFILFNNSFESGQYTSLVTNDCLVLNYIDNIEDFKNLSEYFCVSHVSDTIDNLYNLLIENFDKKLINKYIGFAITNTDIENDLILYLYNKLDNKEDEEDEIDDMCIPQLHNVLTFNFGDIDDNKKQSIKIKYIKEYTDEDTFDTYYKYSKTYSNYDTKVILRYIVKLLSNNNDDIKKEIRYSYFYKLK